MALLSQTMTLPPPKESNFNLSHKHRTDLYIGMATPVETVQMLPGDVINISARAKMITEALSSPCFGQMRLQMDHFFVPYRILWDKWMDFVRQGDESTIQLPTYGVPLFVGNQPQQLSDKAYIALAQAISPDLVSAEEVDSYISNYEYPLESEIDSVSACAYLNTPWINGWREQDFGYISFQDETNANALMNNVLPNISSYNVASDSPFNVVKANSLVNYLDLPAGYFDHKFSNYHPNSLFNILAYNKIWYEWYRNPQEDTYAFYGNTVQSWRGGNDLSIAYSTAYNVIYTKEEMESSIDLVNSSMFNNTQFNRTDLAIDSDLYKYRRFLFSLKKRCYKHDYLSSVLNAENYENATAVVNVSGNQFTINQWRQALHVDKYQKRTYLGGDRYIDWIRAQYGVIDSDARLQRPELISSISSEIVFVDVESTADTDGASLGKLASRGITLNDQPERLSFRATEHGVYMVIASIVPIVDNVYGVSRFTRKVDTFDFFVPALDNIDMQPVHAYEYSCIDDVSQSLSDERWITSFKSPLNLNKLTDYLPVSTTLIKENFGARWEGWLLNRQLEMDRTGFGFAVGYLPAWTEYKTNLNRVTGSLSTIRKNYVLSRPNIFENTLVGLDYKLFATLDVTDGAWYRTGTKLSDLKYLRKQGMIAQASADGTIIVPEFTDNFLNNVYISQYVDFRDYAYLWPDLSGKYPTNVIQFAFDIVMRRPMSKWSMPL